jgi:hypothetical protein
MHLFYRLIRNIGWARHGIAGDRDALQQDGIP